MMVAPPDIVRAAYAELVVADLAAARWFYVDVLGLVVTHEDAETLYLRAFEEYLHHSLVLRKGDLPALARLGYRVRSPREVDAAERYFGELGVPVRREPAGSTPGVGELVRVQDPFGFPVDFFHAADQVERLTQHYHLHPANAVARLDHFNVMLPEVERGRAYYDQLGFGLSETIEDSAGTLFAAWLFRKPTVHDVALTTGEGPRLHHIAFATHERSQILHTCDVLGALRRYSHIERGPGRHGVSNAFYLYLRDPDGHRVEIYTSDYYTGDPDNPTVRWDVTDDRRRSFWGHTVVPSWFDEASTVLDLDGAPVPVRAPAVRESTTQVGADGFAFVVEDAEPVAFEIGDQV